MTELDRSSKVVIGNIRKGIGQEELGNHQAFSGNRLSVLEKQIRELTENLSMQVYPELRKNELPDNSGLISKELLRSKIIELVNNLEILFDWLNPELTGKDTLTKEELDRAKKPIIFVRDECFTNDEIIRIINDILKKANSGSTVDKYVAECFVKYDEDEKSKINDRDIYTKKMLHDNAIIIFGGSGSDVYSLPKMFFNSHLVNYIKEVLYDQGTNNNNRLIGICFGQQILAELLGRILTEIGNVIGTIKGPAQFGPIPCVLEKMSDVHDIYSRCLEGIYDPSKKENKLTFLFTRTGHVIFNLLNRKNKLPIIPLIRDLQGNILGWGTKNGKCFCFQGHPELNFNDDDDGKIQKKLSKLGIDNITRFYENIKVDDVDNNFKGLGSINNIGLEFYVPILLEFTRSIIAELQNTERYKSYRLDGHKTSYDELNKGLVSSIRERLVRYLSDTSEIFDASAGIDEETKRKLFELVDRAGKLSFLPGSDRIVYRGVEECSSVLGLDILMFTKDYVNNHIKEMWLNTGIKKGDNRPVIIRDWGAGNGILVDQLYKYFGGSGILFYGVGDTLFLDLRRGIQYSVYERLKNRNLSQTEKEKLTHIKHIPENVIRIFVDKLVASTANIEGTTIKEKIDSSIDNIQILENDIIELGSTATETVMFSQERISKLNSNDIAYLRHIQKLENDKNPLNILKQDIKENLHMYFEGAFYRIFISDFGNFSIGDNILLKADIQFAIRSTSHLDKLEYRKTLVERITKYSNPGGVFLDNGVVQSYTSIPRISVLQEVQDRFKDIAKIYVIYDQNTNYITTAVILRKPYAQKELLESNLKKGHILLELEEVHSRSLFFTLEEYVRNFLMTQFKDETIFRNHNSKIVKFLNEMISKILHKETEDIEEGIVNLVNIIVDDNNIEYRKQKIREIYENFGNINISDITNIDGKHQYAKGLLQKISSKLDKLIERLNNYEEKSNILRFIESIDEDINGVLFTQYILRFRKILSQYILSSRKIDESKVNKNLLSICKTINNTINRIISLDNTVEKIKKNISKLKLKSKNEVQNNEIFEMNTYMGILGGVKEDIIEFLELTKSSKNLLDIRSILRDILEITETTIEGKQEYQRIDLQAFHDTPSGKPILDKIIKSIQEDTPSRPERFNTSRQRK